MDNRSPINSLAALQAAKVEAIREIEEARIRLEDCFTSIPGKAFGGVLSMVSGAVANGVQHYYQQQAAPVTEEEPASPPSFTDNLKAVGQETAMFALSRMVEKLLAK